MGSRRIVMVLILYRADDKEEGPNVVAELQTVVEAVMREGKQYQSIMRGVTRYGWSYLESEYERVVAQRSQTVVPEGFNTRANILLAFQQLRAQFLAHTSGQESSTAFNAYSSSSSHTSDSSSSPSHWFTQMVLLVLAVTVILTSVTSLKSTRPRNRLRPATVPTATRRQRPLRPSRSFFSSLWDRIRQPLNLENLYATPRMLADAMMTNGKSLCAIPSHLMTYIKFDAVSSAEKVQAELLREEEEKAAAATATSTVVHAAGPAPRDASKKQRFRVEKKGSQDGLKVRQPSPVVTSPPRPSIPSSATPSIKANASRKKSPAPSPAIAPVNEKENMELKGVDSNASVVTETGHLETGLGGDAADAAVIKVLTDISNVMKAEATDEVNNREVKEVAGVKEERRESKLAEDDEMRKEENEPTASAFDGNDLSISEVTVRTVEVSCDMSMKCLAVPALSSMSLANSLCALTKQMAFPSFAFQCAVASQGPAFLKAPHTLYHTGEDFTESSSSDDSQPSTPNRQQTEDLLVATRRATPDVPAAAPRVAPTPPSKLPETQRRTKARPRPTSNTTDSSATVNRGAAKERRVVQDKDKDRVAEPATPAGTASAAPNPKSLQVQNHQQVSHSVHQTSLHFCWSSLPNSCPST